MAEESPEIQPSTIGEPTPIHHQFLRFVLVGIVAAGSDMFLHGFLLFKLQMGGELLSTRLGDWLRLTLAGLPPNLTSHDLSFSALKLLTTLVGIGISFQLNRSFTFTSTSVSRRRQLPRYLKVVAIGLALNTLISSVISYLNPSAPGAGWLIGSIVATGLVAIWNFMGHRLYSFAELPDEPQIDPRDRFSATLLQAFALLVCGIACAVAVLSLSWQPAHDAPVVLYPAHLAWTGQKIPYSGLFDFNFPGTYLIYGVLGQVTNLVPFRLQLADVVLLGIGAALISATYPRSFRTAVLAGYSAFVCLYLSWYSEYGLQREFFGFLLTVGACVLAAHKKSWLWIGFLCGIAILIKPSMALAFVWILVWQGNEEGSWRKFGLKLPLWLSGALMPIVIAALWLKSLGALGAFISIGRNYTPLYMTMNGSHRVISGFDRLAYDLHHLVYPDGDVKWGALIMIVVVPLIWRQLDSIVGLKRIVLLVTGVTVCFYLYPAFSGQFWRYHYLPFWAYCCITLSVGLLPLLKRPDQRAPSYAALAASCIAFAYFSYGALQTFRRTSILPTQKVATQVETYLSKRLKPLDTVQPLDWTGGIVEGMMKAHARLATSFIYDFPFYHSVSTPYVRSLRLRFISELTVARPVFILERLGEDKPWPIGPDTTRSFPELHKFINANYEIDAASKDFNIWKRKSPK